MSVRMNVLCAVCAVSLCAVSFVSAKPKASPMVADINPLPVGSLSFSTDTLIPDSIELRTAEESYHPRTDEMCLQYSFGINKVQFYLGPEARAVLLAGAKQYLTDYEAHTLNEKKKMTEMYGKTFGRYLWGTISYNGEAFPKFSVGYRFIKSSPYFTLYIPNTEDTLNPNGDVSRATGSSILFFTRSQLEAFCDTLDPAILKQAVEEAVKNNEGNKPDTY